VTSTLPRRSIGALAACLLAATLGCSYIDTAISGAAGSAASAMGRTAGDQVGTAAGNQIGGAAVSRWGGAGMTPALQQQISMMYTQYLFSMAFGVGSYAVSTVEYKPGQYTRWNIVGRGDKGKPAVLERARLFDDKDGSQWWKVKWTSTSDDGKTEAIVLEALLSPKDMKMERLRGKFPQDAAGKEMALSENAWYSPPQKLSPKSIEGATKGIEAVTVPAGAFQARHVEFGDIGQTHDWWLVDSVPGGQVKQTTKAAQQKGDSSGPDSSNYTLELAAYGGDAKTELDTK
jgi:hypothetical protein